MKVYDLPIAQWILKVTHPIWYTHVSRRLCWMYFNDEITDHQLFVLETAFCIPVKYIPPLHVKSEFTTDSETLLKWAYAKTQGTDSIIGLDVCDNYKQWKKNLVPETVKE